jgi:hypothetical protein
MIERLARVIDSGETIGSTLPEPPKPYDIPEKAPTVGMLLAPSHDQTRFYTVLEVEFTQAPPEKMPTRVPRMRLQLLKIVDNKKIATVWFDSPEIFWRYYTEM